MIENATIITGTPESAEKQLRKFLASHPNAAVLSSSIHVSHLLSSCLEETTKPSARSKAKAKAEEAPPADSQISNLKSQIAPQEQITVCIVVGIKL